MKATDKKYKCKRCGHVATQNTNHYGETYSFGRFNVCPPCGSAWRSRRSEQPPPARGNAAAMTRQWQAWIKCRATRKTNDTDNMKKPDITPGPWQWMGTNRRPADTAYLKGGNGTYVGACLDSGGFTDSEANARVIAALPDLLEALEECYRLMGVVWERHDDPYGIEHNNATDAYAAAKNALTKAGYTF